jgi:hypothetical protein
MSQDNILTFLRNNKKKWFSRNDLKIVSGCSNSCLTKNMRSLVKYSSCYNLKVKKGKRRKIFLRFD